MRRLLRGATILSLVAFVLAGALCAASFVRELHWGWAAGTHRVDLLSADGDLTWIRFDFAGPAPATMPRSVASSGVIKYADDTPHVLLLLGFHNLAITYPNVYVLGRARLAHERLVVIPYWLFLVATAMLPAAWLVRRLLKRLRHVPGTCRRCGYDLRASPDRCPECGTPAPAPAPAASGA